MGARASADSEAHAASAATALPSRHAPPGGVSDGAHAHLIGKVISDRYKIEALLGEGGMGCVYRAVHVLMKKTVALKILHRQLTHVPEVVARFEREAIAAARIAHPNVAAATDFGRLQDGAFFLALEFIAGKSLRSLIQNRRAVAGSARRRDHPSDCRGIGCRARAGRRARV